MKLLQRLEEAMQTSWVQNIMQQLLPTSLGNFLVEQIEETSPQLKEAPELAKVGIEKNKVTG